LVQLERKTVANAEQRIKYASDPRRFMESEADLDQAIAALHVLAAAPHVFGIVVELGMIESLVALLAHENTDILIHSPASYSYNYGHSRDVRLLSAHAAMLTP
jgi:beta-catenin-like protein 1